MELKDLSGLHALTVGGMNTAVPVTPRWTSDIVLANGILFTLDGRTYCVTEDEDDGYRSSMRDIEELPATTQLRNTFVPCQVLARYRGGSEDILECIDVVTGQVVLEVGTTDTDDYYPQYVANFTPEHMAANAPVPQDAESIRQRHVAGCPSARPPEGDA